MLEIAGLELELHKAELVIKIVEYRDYHDVGDCIGDNDALGIRLAYCRDVPCCIH